MAKKAAAGAPRIGSSALRVDIVDEDASVRRAVGRLLHSVGLRSSSYGSAQEYLETGDLASAACLLIDLHNQGFSIVELVQQLSQSNPNLPVICMIHRDEPDLQRWLTVSGVGGYLHKPFDQVELFQAIAKLTPFRLP